MSLSSLRDTHLYIGAVTPSLHKHQGDQTRAIPTFLAVNVLTSKLHILFRFGKIAFSCSLGPTLDTIFSQEAAGTGYTFDAYAPDSRNLTSQAPTSPGALRPKLQKERVASFRNVAH
jgi:hypothetical protein